MTSDKQLHSILPSGVELAVGTHATKRELYYKKAAGLPTIYYPDGSYCAEANSWLVKLFRNTNTSLRRKGGTYGQYAHNLAPLLRYLFLNRIHPIDMTDNRFVAYINGLSAKRTKNDAPIRSDNTIRTIGSTALHFLNHVGELHHDEHFLGRDGTIKAYKVEKNLPPEKRDKATAGLVWYHPCFPTPGPEHRRYPIGDKVIAALREAAELRPRPLAKRSKTLISVLEHTPARVGEAAELLASDVLRAAKMDDHNPLIRLTTFKRRARHYRYVPVPKSVILIWVDYINTTRKTVMLRCKKLVDDHDIMFVNHRTGNPLSTSTLPNELSDLKAAAGIQGPAHAHLFRHRFITNKLKMLILQFEFDNQDDFRRALLDITGFKQKIQEWVGHVDIKSLERYIHLAVKEITQEASSVQNALLMNALVEMDKYCDDLMDQLDNGHIDATQYISAMRDLRRSNKIPASKTNTR